MSETASAMDVRGALREGLHRLREAQVPSHSLAAELLLMQVLRRDRAWLYAHPEEPLERPQAERYFELIAQRGAGVPTQYLTGRQEFWGLEFEVTRDVLIPRPETEHVVEVALARLGGKRSRSRLRVADVGTGSGCLAVALARELPQAEIVATDISPAALEVARRNATRHGVASRVHFVQCSLLDALECGSLLPHSQNGGQPRHSAIPPDFDLIVSNPPYVGRDEKGVLPREVRDHEPEQALFAGESGFDFYAPLIRQAEQLLAPGGVLVLELGYNSLAAVRPLVETPAWVGASVTRDLAGIPRVLAAEKR